MTRRRLATIVVVATLIAAVAVAALHALVASTLRASADEAWTIENFHADIAIQRDTSLQIAEAIDVDFGSLQKHGIFRDIPIEYPWDSKHHRVYQLDVTSVTDASGTKWPYKTGRQGVNERIQIGDPDRLISGKQTYRIHYVVRYAMNGFDDHDELFWNVNGGNWPVPTKAASATMTIDGGAGFTQSQCYEGAVGSKEACAITPSDGRIDYTGGRAFRSGEQLTVVAGVRKGVVATPQVRLERLPRTLPEFFSLAPGIIALAIIGSIGAIVAVIVTWWRHGRDRVYTSIYYLSKDPTEKTRPMFYRDSVVVEYTPMDGLRPAQMGLLLDQRIDDKDVTATIVDLAVRGYLTIEELPRHVFFLKPEYKLTKRRDGDGLAEWERSLFDGVFEAGDEVQLSELKGSYLLGLNRARNELYKDSVREGWFTRDPESSRHWWSGAGVAVAIAGGAIAYFLGSRFGAALVGLPIVLAGLLLVISSRWMPKRTAKGSEELRRVLGFRLYVDTAETRRQEFNEKENIFATYLPFAIVFGSVHKWAKAFAGIDAERVVGAWYVGSGGSLTDFSDHLSSFSTSVGASVPSGAGGGGSGFGGGGGAGGGGGGGGGGSW